MLCPCHFPAAYLLPLHMPICSPFDKRSLNMQSAPYKPLWSGQDDRWNVWMWFCLWSWRCRRWYTYAPFSFLCSPLFFPLAFSTVSYSLPLIVPCIVIVKEVLAWRKREGLFLGNSLRHCAGCTWHSFTFIEIVFPLGAEQNVPKAIIASIDSVGFHGRGFWSQVVQKWPLWAKVQAEWRFWDGD